MCGASWKRAGCSWSFRRMGRSPDPYATDTLLADRVPSAFCAGAGPAAVDRRAALFAAGERGAAQRQGSSAYALPLHQSGIVTDDDYDYAHVRALRAQGVRAALDEHAVVVACGFIAASVRGEVTTLGRGGSDFSAVLFAHMLGLEEADIYTDVDAVYSMDPRVDPSACRHERLSYEEMLKLHSRVLHARCVRYAQAHHIRIHLRGTFSDTAGTLIA